MTTVIDIITLALKDINVLGTGETAPAADASDCLSTLNQLLGQWQAQKMLVTGQHDVSFSATGAQTYTIGTGQAINAPLPVTIDQAFYRLNGVDYPLAVLSSFEDYENITMKTLAGTIPSVVFLQRGATTGTVYVWPQPSTGAIHLTLRDVLDTYASLSDTLTLPAEYLLALRYSLAEQVMPSYGVGPRPDIVALAARARRVLKRLNTQIPMMGQPPELIGNGRFSVYSGQ